MGTALKAIGATYGPSSPWFSTSPSSASDAGSSMAAVWSAKVSTPARPEPETAWNVVTCSASRPATSCSAFNGAMAAIVVQFGLAMMPISARSTSPGLTSDTTSGTRSSSRHAEELSITVAPAWATFSAHALEVLPPAEKRATSSPAKLAFSMSSTTTSRSLNFTVEPAERCDANARSSSTG